MSREYVLQPFRAPVELRIDYARELNEQQHAAVTAVPGPALVIAGAGSGKTRTLTYRVAYLLEQGIPPERILLLTFTNKAAKEMMRRVAEILGEDISSLWGGTFHSVGNRILRRHAEALGHRPGFTILDREDSTELLKATLDGANIDIKAARFPKAEVLADIYSMAANTRRTVAEVLAGEYEDFKPLTPKILEVQQLFTVRKREANVMDFDDLLTLWLELLEKNEEARELYQRRFQFILVDEYQDTNQLQGDIIDLLAARHRNVMVVGDDSQSIYSWRGANFRNILEFPKRYPGAKVYKIETNYRSTPEILALANASIASNLAQFSKQLVASRKPGAKPVLITCGDGNEQAAFVAQRALELRDEGVNLNDMAVLYRSHFHTLELQLELTRRNIPFSITSGIRFFEQAHIKDVAAYLKLIVNPNDELSFKRLARMLPGVGGKSADKLWTLFALRLREQLAGIEPGAPKPGLLKEALNACAPAVPKKTGAAWGQLTETLTQLDAEPVRQKTGEMIQLVIDAGYADYLKETFPNHRNRLEDIEQLSVFSRQFESPGEFLSQLALLSNLDSDESRPASDETEQIKLSTIHQAKGLEFPVVFLIMLCDGLFPSARSIGTIEGEEEERRLFYVAVTRAKNELYLSYPLIRATAGYTGEIMQLRSRFLDEIPDELIDEWNLRGYG